MPPTIVTVDVPQPETNPTSDTQTNSPDRLVKTNPASRCSFCPKKDQTIVAPAVPKVLIHTHCPTFSLRPDLLPRSTSRPTNGTGIAPNSRP